MKSPSLGEMVSKYTSDLAHQKFEEEDECIVDVYLTSEFTSEVTFTKTGVTAVLYDSGLVKVQKELHGPVEITKWMDNLRRWKRFGKIEASLEELRIVEKALCSRLSRI